MLCSSCSICRSNKNIRGDTTMTQQGITETRMHSDSNLDSHHYKMMNAILKEIAS